MSICMPAYNAGKYINEAVGSILKQSYKNWELIIVNDGSTDDTGALIGDFTDPRIRVYEQENKGQCAAANKAFSYSSGELIKFMDADDIISVDFIREQVARLGASKNVIASASWGRFYDDDLATFKLAKKYIVDDCRPIDWLINALEHKNAMMQCAIWLIPRSILERSGLWDESLNLINDLEFFIRVLLKADEIRLTPNAVLYYRSGLPDSLSALKSRAGAESAFNSTLKGTSYILEQESSPRARKVVADCFQNYVYTFYPYHTDLLLRAQNKIAELGGSNAQFTAGGYTDLLTKIIGWKRTKKIKSWWSELNLR